MITRELYRQKYEAQLQEWSAKLDEVKAHAHKLGAEARLEMKPIFDGCHAKLTLASAKLEHMRDATDDAWEDVTRDAEKAWHDLTASIEGAFDAVKSHARKRRGSDAAAGSPRSNEHRH